MLPVDHFFSVGPFTVEGKRQFVLANADDQIAIAGILSAKDFLSQRVLQVLAQGSLERTSAVLRLKSLVGKELFGVLGQVEADPFFRQLLLNDGGYLGLPASGFTRNSDNKPVCGILDLGKQ